jgi:hypothetical protein
MGEWRLVGSAALALAALVGTSACSDEPTPVVSAAEYDQTAADLCERHAGIVVAEFDTSQASGQSDAEWVSLVRTELVPRLRAVVRGLQSTGFPAEHAAEYSAGLDQVMVALSEVDDEDEAYSYLDRSRRGAVPKDQDPLVRIDEGLAAANVDNC